ncbi:MAG: polysaccharide deacetylase family protein [Candidatus Nomurabacteria bacterium]|nr:polysaccharide deacetylase family protein [Candidatus Saccharibacteria bacterium]USN95214.1 MAG: polysaccharide deacetylase family protein [Candidatus Nomurabacteria bacterium]
MFKSFVQKIQFLVLLTLCSFVFGSIRSPHVHASVQNPTPQAQVSFTFDDGASSVYNKAVPTLAQYGFTGTSYVITGCVGMVTVPNNCEADNDVPYMTWSQVVSLQNTYGWEVGSHGVSHQLMSEISAKKIDKELLDSKNQLVAHGLNVSSFATPYGDYNQKVLANIAKYYSSHRPFHDTGYNHWPYNDYLLRVQQVQAGVSVDTVKSYIDQASNDGTWLILVFHDIRDVPSTNPEDYQYSTADLSAIASYIKSKNIKVTNIDKGIVKSDASDNLVASPDTGKTIGGGWTTDTPKAVKIDATSKGSNPDPVKSIKVTANAKKSIHVFTPLVTIQPNDQYVVKGYINLDKNSKGVGLYIDEYDASGNWISGQYKQTINTWYDKDISFMYVASSSSVACARLQIIVTANSGVKVYIDNVRWFVAVSGPAPDPELVNLLTNGDFEQGLTGWSIDDPAISLDTANNGTSPTPVNSIKLTNIEDRSVQLFSSKVNVINSKTYNINADMNVLSLNANGEIGFYIDEYDTSGNWISGQYLYTVRQNGLNKVDFSYTPTSINVASSSLQVIVSKGIGTVAYLDNVKFTTA